MTIALPQISSYDPATLSDGSLDPLGLYLISDRLATKLAPGIRERMSHPRYLTAMALGAHICSPFNTEYASDGFSSAYQVYEWHIVEGFTFKYLRSEPDQIQSLPGIQKATEAFRMNQPLNASRYLKTANVFGFHGVYRTLSTDLRVVSDEYIMQELGHHLLMAMQEEHDLKGLYTGSGPWADKVKLFRDGIEESMRKGEVARGWNWNIHQEFASIIRPSIIKEKEAQLILDALCSDGKPLRKQVVEFLMSEKGQKAWREIESEKLFVAELNKHADAELKDLLKVITAYEHFARCFQDAFDDCRHKMSKSGKATLEQLAELEGVKRAALEMPKIFEEIEMGLTAFNMHADFIRFFGDFAQPMNGSDWVVCMWHHHNKIQNSKGRLGKRNWFERIEDGTFRIYPNTIIQNPIKYSNEFLHGYRTQALWSFLINLKFIPNGE